MDGLPRCRKSLTGTGTVRYGNASVIGLGGFERMAPATARDWPIAQDTAPVQ